MCIAAWQSSALPRGRPCSRRPMRHTRSDSPGGLPHPLGPPVEVWINPPTRAGLSQAASAPPPSRLAHPTPFAYAVVGRCTEEREGEDDGSPVKTPEGQGGSQAAACAQGAERRQRQDPKP